MKTSLRKVCRRSLKLELLVLFLLFINIIYAQSSGDYRTSAAGTWSTASNWQKYNGSTWVAASTAPDYTNGAIAVNHAMTIGANITLDQVTVASGASITINSTYTLTLNGNITDNGTITDNGSLVCGAYIISGSGTFTLASGGAISIGSTDGISSSGTTGNIQTSTRNFNAAGKYTYNSSSAQVSGSGLPTTLSSSGSITVANTNSLGLNLSNNIAVNSPASFTVNNGAILNCGSTTVIGGSGTFTLASGGTIIIGSSVGISSSGSSGNIQTTTRSFSGGANYIYSNLTSAQNTGNGLPTTLTGSLTINTSVSSGVSLSSSYTINTPGTVTVNGILTCGTYVLSGTGTFTLSSGGTIQSANSSGLNGSVTCSTRSFSTNGNYTFNSSAANQTIGSYMPSTVNNLTISNSYTSGTVKLSQATTIGGTLYLNNGTLCYNGFTLSISNNATISRGGGTMGTCSGSGSVSLGSPINVTYTGTSNVNTGPEMPTSSTGLATLTVYNNIGITLTSNITVNTQLILTKGTITLNSYSLNYASGATLKYNGTDAQQVVTNAEWPSTFDKDIIIANTYTTGVLLNADKSSYTGNITVPGVLNVSTYAIKGSGSFLLNAGGTLITAWTTGIVSNSGIQLSGGRSWGTGGNFVFNGSSAQVTGTEMPSTINSLNVNNSSGVTLTQNTEMTASYSTTPYYCLYLTNGVLTLGAHTMVLDGVIYFGSGSITGGTSSKIYFGGSNLSTSLPSISGGLSALGINRYFATITLGANITVFDTLDLWNGALSIGANTMTLDGVINNSGATLMGGSSSNITINNYASDITLPGITYGINNLYINRSSANSVMSYDLTVSGTLTLNNGAFSINGNTLDLKGSLSTVSGYLLGGSTSNLTIDSSTATLILSSISSGLNNFSLNRLNGVNLTGNLLISGNFDLSAGVFTIGSNTLELDGTYSISAGSITGGSSSNLVAGGTNYPFYIPYIKYGLHNFTVNNANGVILGANLVVSNNVTFTSGTIGLDNYNLSLLNANGISGYNGTNYFVSNNTPSVGGTLVQYAAGTPVIFPVGTSTSYTPATVDNSAGTADSFYVRVVNGILDGATSGSDVANLIMDVNRTWFITEYASTSNAAITLQWNASDQNANFDVNNYGISSYGGSEWDLANFSPMNSPSSGIYTATRTGLGTFNAFGVGNKNRALPVKLLNFSGMPSGQNVILNWSTTTEINNDHFTLERSKDGRNFQELIDIKGAGNTTSLTKYDYVDMFPYTGTSYYRLKQVDYNGNYEYSAIISVHFGGVNDNINLSVDPNPCKDFLKVQFASPNEGKMQIRVLDLSGKTLITQSSDYESGSNGMIVYLGNIPAGVYVLQMTYNNNIINRRIVKSDQ